MILMKQGDEYYSMVCPKYDSSGRLVLRTVQLGANSYYSPHLKAGVGIAAYYKAYGLDDSDCPTILCTRNPSDTRYYVYTTLNSCWYNLGSSQAVKSQGPLEQVGWCNAGKYTDKIRGTLYDTWDKYFHRKDYSFDFGSVAGHGTPAGGFKLEGISASGWDAWYTQEALIAINSDAIQPTRTTRLIYSGSWSNGKPSNPTSSNVTDMNALYTAQPIKSTCSLLLNDSGSVVIIRNSAGAGFYVWKVATTVQTNGLLPPPNLFAMAQGSTTNPIYILKGPSTGAEFMAKIIYERVSFSMNS